jgi:hypothetical protein
MRTHLEFRSTEFPPMPGEEGQINAGRYGRRLANLLSQELPQQGFEVTAVTPEDWGWRIDIESETFPLWIGCGNYEEYEDGFLCFIEPSRPWIRRRLMRVSTTTTVERLARAIDSILAGSGKADHMRWWTEAEALRG